MSTKQALLEHFLAKGKRPSKEAEKESSTSKKQKFFKRHYIMSPTQYMDLSQQVIPTYQP